MQEGIEDIEQDIAWFKTVLHARLTHYFQQNEEAVDPLLIEAPNVQESTLPYASFVRRHGLNTQARLVLMLALMPLLKPQLLDIFLKRNELFDKPYSEFGGVEISGQSGFVPTVQTALFLLAGDTLALRAEASALFDKSHPLVKQGILDLHTNNALPFVATPLRVEAEVYQLLLTGKIQPPATSIDFPATELHTRLEWNDLVLSPDTIGQLLELKTWLNHGDVLMTQWELSRHLKPGYRCLFCGPPGTGKTLTATLLGKLSKRSVYRIDLSRLVSKYIGETEKNLEKIFSLAEEKNWILFFDEADSLFGARTQITRSNDRYANQETAYLLQRIDTCPNVVILASNLKNNIDEAFTRRFQSVIDFPMPSKKERLRLWKQAFGAAAEGDNAIDFEEIAARYEMAGGSIINVVRYSALMAIRKNQRTVAPKDLIDGIRRELKKQGLTV